MSSSLNEKIAGDRYGDPRYPHCSYWLNASASSWASLCTDSGP